MNGVIWPGIVRLNGENVSLSYPRSPSDDYRGILDIWHVTEYVWKLACCFFREGSKEAEVFVDTYLRKLLEGKVGRVIGGIRQMATKRELVVTALPQVNCRRNRHAPSANSPPPMNTIARMESHSMRGGVPSSSRPKDTWR